MTSSDGDTSVLKVCSHMRQYSTHISLFVTSTLLTTATQIFAPLSKDDSGEYEYSKPSAVFLAELLKLFLALSMLTYEAFARSYSTEPPPANQPRLIAADPLKTFGLYLIPTALWFANNNIVFYVVQGISPATNQAVGQSKVLFTVLLLYMLLGRRFNFQQLLALGTLVCALVIMAFEDDATHAAPAPTPAPVGTPGTTMPMPMHNGSAPASLYDEAAPGHALSRRELRSHYTINPAVAILLSILISFNGSLAGVYNEKLLKELDSCIHFQNAVAYVLGCGWNAAYMFIDSTSRDILKGGLLTGYNGYTWAYVISAATMGLSVSFMFKYQDNISRLLAIATSIGVTLFISIPALGIDVSIGQGTGVVLIALTLLAYYDGSEKQKATEKAQREREAKEGTGLLSKS